MKIVFSAVWEHMRSERRAYVRETVFTRSAVIMPALRKFVQSSKRRISSHCGGRPSTS